MSFAVLATNRTPTLLKASPFAPKGGTPLGSKSGLVTHAVATPPAGPVFQMIPWNESEM